MKILIIHNRYQVRGGEDEVVDSEKTMLEKFGHQVILYAKDNTEISRYSILRKIKFFLRDIYWSKSTYRDIRQIINREKPDLAHFHNTLFVITPSAYQACYDAGVPIVQTLHNYRFLCPIGTFYRDGRVCEECLKGGRKSAVFNKCYRSSYIQSFMLANIIVNFYKRGIISKSISHFIALSEFTQKKFIANGIPRSKLSIKSNFIDFDPGCSKKRGDYALFVGALMPYKGLKTLFKAWKKVDPAYPLKIIGSGPLKDKVLSFIRKTTIEYLGHKPLNETIEQIKHAAFLVFTSECYETCPRVIIEAFACGVPVIASDMGPAKELVTHHQTGLLFRCGDAADLVKKITYCLHHKEYLEIMGRNARKVYLEKYALERNYNKLKSIYDRVIQNHAMEVAA